MNKRIGTLLKIMVGSAFFVSMALLCGQRVQAGIVEETVGVYIGNQERSLLDDVNLVFDENGSKTRSIYIGYGSVKLTKASSTRAEIAATTQCLETCDAINMDIYVDRYDPDTNRWNQWRYWEYSTTNSQHLTKNMLIIVQSGYYYSVRGVHACRKGNVVETIHTQTDGLYIGTTDTPV